jgi:hypothetical protein
MSSSHRQSTTRQAALQGEVKRRSMHQQQHRAYAALPMASLHTLDIARGMMNRQQEYNARHLCNVRSARHRRALSDVLSALRIMQGVSAPSVEEKVIKRGTHEYEVYAYGYQYPVTAVHLRSIESIPYVTKVCVDFSLAPTVPTSNNAHGAVRATVFITPPTLQTTTTTPTSKKRAMAEYDVKDDDNDDIVDGERPKQRRTITSALSYLAESVLGVFVN